MLESWYKLPSAVVTRAKIGVRTHFNYGNNLGINGLNVFRRPGETGRLFNR